MPEVQVNKYAKIIVSVIDTYMYYKRQSKMGTCLEQDHAIECTLTLTEPAYFNWLSHRTFILA